MARGDSLEKRIQVTGVTGGDIFSGMFPGNRFLRLLPENMSLSRHLSPPSGLGGYGEWGGIGI